MNRAFTFCRIVRLIASASSPALLSRFAAQRFPILSESFFRPAAERPTRC